MKSLLPDVDLSNANADRPWRKSEIDRLLDLYFAGASPDRLAQILKRNPKAIRRMLEQFTYNERDRAVLYQPYRPRVSRKGKRWTENERLLVVAHHERKIPFGATVKVLARTVGEFKSVKGEVGKIKEKNVFAPTLDLIMA